MSKLFTVKDFIIYNNPCFSCGDQIIFKFETSFKNNSTSINPIVTNTHIEVALKNNYSKFINLQIDNKTNTFQVTNIEEFKKYDKELFLSSRCNKCSTYMFSNALKFNMKSKRIEATTIAYEQLKVNDDYFYYRINTSDVISHITIFDNKWTKIFEMETSPIYLYSLKTKERLISKLKTYLVFT